MKTRFLWMILKISLPSGRHREGPKINHFDKNFFSLICAFLENNLFSAQNWRILSVVERTRLQIGADFRLWHQNWCRFRERDFCCGIKIDAILITSSLIPSGRSHLSRCFWKKPPKILLLRRNPVIALHFLHGWKPFCAPLKKIPSPNPHWETVLSTYPARISPTIPYSNFCNWKTTRFLKKFSLNPIPQLSKPKNDIFSETFSKNVLTPLPHVFEPKTEALFQKSFLLLYRKFFRANLNTNLEKT